MNTLGQGILLAREVVLSSEERTFRDIQVTSTLFKSQRVSMVPLSGKSTFGTLKNNPLPTPSLDKNLYSHHDLLPSTHTQPQGAASAIAESPLATGETLWTLTLTPRSSTPSSPREEAHSWRSISPSPQRMTATAPCETSPPPPPRWPRLGPPVYRTRRLPLGTNCCPLRVRAQWRTVVVTS